MYSRKSESSVSESPAPTAAPAAAEEAWLAPGGGNAMAASSVPPATQAASGPAGELENPDWAADLEDEGGLVGAAIAIVDGLVVPGAGIAASGHLAASLLLLVSAGGGTVTVTNSGGGFVSLRVDFDAAFGAGMGVGGKLLGEGLGAEVGGALTTAGAIEVLIPWASLAGGDLLTRLGAATSLADVMAAFAEVLDAIDDLGRYVVAVEGGVGAELGGNLEADLGGLVSADAALLATLGVSYAVTWDPEQSKADGGRGGFIELSGTATSLAEAAAGIPWLAGIDLSLFEGEGSVTLRVPQTQLADGNVTFGTPSLVTAAKLGTGGTSVGVETSMGGESTSTLTLGLAGGGVVSEALLFAASSVGLDGPGNPEIGAELSLTLDTGAIGEAQVAAATAVGAWLVGTGPAPDPGELGGQTAEAVVAAADVALAIDAEWVLAEVEGGLEIGAGLELGGELEGSQSLVYRSDDVLPEIGQPTFAEVLDAARSGLV